LAGWENPPPPSGLELAYAQVTAVTPITDVAEGTGTALITLPTVNLDGSPVIVEMFGVVILDTNAVGDVMIFSIFEGAVQVSRICTLRAAFIAPSDIRSAYGKLKFTPAAGAHTYKLTAFAPSVGGAPSLAGGTGGTVQNPPAFVRLTKA
jgi:hypothetical protein